MGRRTLTARQLATSLWDVDADPQEASAGTAAQQLRESRTADAAQSSANYERISARLARQQGEMDE